MYTVYESSPRRSPRNVSHSVETNILKPKSHSPIRKTKSHSSKKATSSANAWSESSQNVPPKKVRKRKVNDEDKENVNVAVKPRRTTGLGVNGSSENGKNRDHLKSRELRDRRLPLKELPLNGFLDSSKKGYALSSVEITVSFHGDFLMRRVHLL
jgi:hypothetical protein